jgi:hypothetical protein
MRYGALRDFGIVTRGRRGSKLGRSGKQCEGLHVARAQDSEVAVVESCKLRLVEAFNDGKDGSVDEADVGIGVLLTDVKYPWIVAGLQLSYLKGTILDIAKERDQDTWVQTPGNQVVHFGQDRHRDKDGLIGILDQSTAREVVCIIAIK